MLLNFRKEFGRPESRPADFHCDHNAGATVNQARRWSPFRSRSGLGHDANLYQKVTSRGGAVDSAIVPYSAAAQTVTLGSNKC
jgi:hypothetical protein